MNKPLVSIIIPTYNEEKVVKRLLNSIRNQSYLKCEAIIVDDGSTDNTVQIAQRLATKVYKRPHAERSIQRNFGVSKSRGQYLLFLDADMELTSDVVKDCVLKIKKDSKIGAIAIPERPVATNFLEQIKAFERSFYSENGDPDTDAARFFTRKVFLEAGGYDETLIGPEDWDLPETVSSFGYKIDRVKSLIFHYERVSSLLHLLKKKYYYALSSHRYFAKHNLSLVGPKAIYFLRPIFYKNWKKLIFHPLLTLGMFIVLSFEQIAGGLGYLAGKYRNL